MNAVAILAVLSLAGAGHAQWTPLVAPQQLPRAPFARQADQTLPQESRSLHQQALWPPRDTPLPLHHTQWPLEEIKSQPREDQLHTQESKQALNELPKFQQTLVRPSRRPTPEALVPSLVSSSYSSHDSVNVTVDGQTGEVSVVKLSIEKFKPGVLMNRLHPRQVTALLKGTSEDQDSGSGPRSFVDPRPEDVTFELYTSQTKGGYETLVATNASSVVLSSFDARRWTVVISHGFTGDADHSPWMHAIRDELLKKDANVILVQWTELSARFFTPFEYGQAADNVKFVGAETGKLLHLLKDAAQLSADNLYLIGFSLGAHVVGFAGKKFPGIARITGLDPAGPLFDGVVASERLDKTDAKFVDVVHTNQALCGYRESIGHVDFYVNGGENQPDCSTFDNILGCSHTRAHELFISSLRSDDRPPKAFQCSEYENFWAGACLGNPFNNFGIHAQSSKPGDYYLGTLVIEGDASRYTTGRLASHYLLEATVGAVPDKAMELGESLELALEFYIDEHTTRPDISVPITSLGYFSNPSGKHVSTVVSLPLQAPLQDWVTRLSYRSNLGFGSKALTMQLLSLTITDTTVNQRFSACNITVPSDDSVTVRLSDQGCPAGAATKPWFF